MKVRHLMRMSHVGKQCKRIEFASVNTYVELC